MLKTTVYLDEADASAHRRLGAASGRSQAELIREAIAEKTWAAVPRQLSFIGVGRGTGEPVGRRADEIVRAELGRSQD